MKVLLPLLGVELDEAFLEKAANGVQEMIVLLVIDTSSLDKKPFGFMGSEIMQGNALLADVSNWFKQKNLGVTELSEWGGLQQKIASTAKREAVNKIVFKSEESKYFHELIRALSRELDIEIQVIQ